MYLAPARLRQAAILARMGRHEAAREHYTRALALWQDAEPALERYVADARRALAGRSGGTGSLEASPR
jgi:predicted RNA polymerase sigma factor